MRKVRPGDKLEIPAAAYNAFIDAAQYVAQHQHDKARALAADELRRQDYVLIRNDSGTPRDRFDILGINGVLIKPTENLNEFKSRIVLRGIMPQPRVHMDNFAVLLDTLPVGGIGRACISGACITRVRMLNEYDQYAAPFNSASWLYSGAGTSRLLWVEPPDERQNPWAWCVVRTGSFPDTPILVRVIHTGNLNYSIYSWTPADAPPDPMPPPLATDVKWRYKLTGTAGLGNWQPAPYWSIAIAARIQDTFGPGTVEWRLLWCREFLPVFFYDPPGVPGS